MARTRLTPRRLTRGEQHAVRLAEACETRTLARRVRELASTAALAADPLPAAQLRELAAAALILSRRLGTVLNPDGDQ